MPERPKLFRKNATDEPGELVAFPGAYARTRPGNNLPLQLSSLIGRHRERTKAGRLLAERRLLTLTGPGGSGKRRLALAVAGDVAEDFEDGMWWVALAPLSDPEFVPQAVAWVLEVREGPGRPLIETLAEPSRIQGDAPDPGQLRASGICLRETRRCPALCLSEPAHPCDQP
jgi:hypothetical protein